MNVNNFEIWADVPGFEGAYAVSTAGRVYSLRAGRVLIPIWTGKKRKQYATVVLQTPGRRVQRKVHHLVLELFVGQRPEGALGRHMDDDTRHNYVGNLCWGSHTENAHDSVANGRKATFKLTPAQRVEIMERYSRGESYKAMAEEYGISAGHAYCVATGRMKTAPKTGERNV